MADSKYYIAYGSNLNLAQMKRRCPTAEVVGAAALRNWRLVFQSVATIERCKGAKVPILVWRILPQDEKALDRYEGWPHLYRKETLRITVNRKRVCAMVYIMNRSGAYAIPSSGYYNTIRQGYQSAGFDTRILDEAVEVSRKLEGGYDGYDGV